jgi:aminopeptidase N
MPALTQTEAVARAALLDVETCDVFLDLTATPARSRTELRFRCRQPGAETFADLTADFLGATLNGAALDRPEDGRLMLRGLAPENALIVEAEVPERALPRFADGSDEYLLVTSFPAGAPDVFACFDQPDIGVTTTLTLVAPPDWECLGNGPVAERPSPGGPAPGSSAPGSSVPGIWRFEPVRSLVPFEFTLCAGPFTPNASGGTWSRRVLAGVADTDGFNALARDALRRYEATLGVPCPSPKYDIVFHPDLQALAMSVPGLMVVNEVLLERFADPDDDFAAMVARHEVLHQWFGCTVGMRWWDDLWIDEAVATYASYPSDTDWIAFSYRQKERAYHADAIPGTQPVSSPVETMAQALDRPSAITYVKGAASVRQLAALIGEQTVYQGLNDYLTRYAPVGTARLDDLVGCWTRASRRDLAGWADEWLRTTGTSTLRPSLTPGTDGTIGSLTVLQDNPRTHRIGIGLYDRNGNRLRRRQVVSAEISGARTPVPELAGEPLPDAIILNDGDQTFARVRFDDRTRQTLCSVAMNTGDPLTEAVCWNAAWHLVTSAELPAAALVSLVTRRLRDDPPLPLAGLEVLTDRAVEAANTWAPASARTVLRESLAAALLEFSERAVVTPPVRRVLAGGFAASAQTDVQLDVLRSWLDADRADTDRADAALCWKFLSALAARDRVPDAELKSFATADPAGGETNAAACRAMRPDPVAKDGAWSAALAAAKAGRWRMAAAHARGIWVPGQEEIMEPFRERYFGETLPLLASWDRGRPGQAREAWRLAGLLFPVTLADPMTIAAAEHPTLHSPLGEPFRMLLLERETVLRAVVAARAKAEDVQEILR